MKVNCKVFIIVFISGLALASDIDAEIIKDLDFYQNMDVLEDLDQLQNDQIIETIPVENSQTPQEVGNE